MYKQASPHVYASITPWNLWINPNSASFPVTGNFALWKLAALHRLRLSFRNVKARRAFRPIVPFFLESLCRTSLRIIFLPVLGDLVNPRSPYFRLTYALKLPGRSIAS
jgi:hypothetical protein